MQQERGDPKRVNMDFMKFIIKPSEMAILWTEQDKYIDQLENKLQLIEKKSKKVKVEKDDVGKEKKRARNI